MMITADIVCLLLICFIVYRETIYRKDISQLIDRVMARNLPEYKATTGELKPKETVSMSDRSEYECYCKRNGLIPDKEEN